MVKKTSHKIFSVVMAFMVLCSTVSFTIQKHFCGDTLIDVAMFSKPSDCGMNMDDINLTSFGKKDCCKHEIVIIQGQDKLKITSVEDLRFSQQLFLSTFLYTYTNLFEGLPEQIIPHRDYSPPNLIADIQVLNQVFII